MPRARRWFIRCAWAIAFSTVSVGIAAAQDQAWSLESLDYPTAPEAFPRGPGFYYSLPKLAIFYGLFLAWVAIGDWVNRDAIQLKISVRRWNPIVLASFLAAVALSWVTSSFWLGLIAQVTALAVPTWLYVKQRNQVADIDDRVLTSDHLRYLVQRLLGRAGVKVKLEKKSREESPVDFVARGGATDRDDTVNLFNAKRLPGYAAAGRLLVDAVERRANVIMLEYAPQSVTVRYQIDGVWRDAPGPDRELGDSMLEVFKTVAALDPAQRVAPQQGAFDVRRNKQSIAVRFSSRGTSSAERVVLRFDDGAPHKARLNTIGLADKPLADLQAAVERRGGLIVCSAPVGGGLTTLLTATTAAVDRYMRSVAALEEARHRDLDVENVVVSTYDAQGGKSSDAALLEVIRQYPDVLVVPNPPDGATVDRLCEQASGERLVITSIAAHDAPTALLRLGTLKGSWKSLVKAASASVNMRLVRKLCEHCKEAYTPPAHVLEKLGLAGKVDTLYRPPEPPPETDKKARKEWKPCSHCDATGYRGRTGMFEVLIVDDAVRNVLLADPKPESVRAAARKAGMRSLQDEGIRLAAEGVTSLAEVTRVLKQKD